MIERGGWRRSAEERAEKNIAKQNLSMGRLDAAAAVSTSTVDLANRTIGPFDGSGT
jgi:hypothetical protein